MKKLLLFILSILIGFTCFGYCEDFIYVFSSSQSLYNPDGTVAFNISFSNGNFWSRSNYSSFILSGFSSSVLIDEICVPYRSSYLPNFSSNGSYLSFNGHNFNSYYITGNFFVCFNISGYDISLDNYNFNDIYIHYSNTESLTCGGYTKVTSFSTLSGYYLLGSGFSLNITSYYSSTSAFYFIKSIKFHTPEASKFTINYGSNSYEITQDTDIYINSPVVKDGNTFTYDGIVGINLFYNGGSVFYQKDKLYVNTPSWYNNGIFTPVCL